jgi:hypothetical protein
MNQSRVVVVACVALVILAAIFGQSHHPHFFWDYIPAFSALLGYGGCWLLVVSAKALGKHWLERGEGYYDE